MILLDEHHANDAADRRVGRQEGLVAFAALLPINRAGDGLPAALLSGTLGETELVFAVLARSTTLAPFSGTLDFQGPSAVTEPSTSRDAAASSVSSTDPGVLAAFTGSGTLPFHLQSAISEVFNGGGGNVQAQINTFVSAAVRVCYTYAVPEVSAAPTV